jgi:hypothetical protein
LVGRLLSRRRPLLPIRLLHLLAPLPHLGAPLLHLLAELVLLVGAQHAHDLTAHVASALRIAWTAGRMRLRVLMNDRLDLLLLLAREIDAAEALRPTVLHYGLVGCDRSLRLSRRRRLGLLCGDGERQCQHCSQNADHKLAWFHDHHILADAVGGRLKARLGPSERLNRDRINGSRGVRLEALKVIEEQLR